MRREGHQAAERWFFKALLAGFACAQLSAASARAQSTAFVYQGLVRVEGQAFSGSGQFKFALLSAPENSARQARAVAVVNSGFITSYTVTDGGAGYSAAPTVAITDATGSNAMAIATVSMGQVIHLMVVAPGSGYSASPQVNIGPPEIDSSPRTSWSNDGTSVNGSEPATPVSIDVGQGAFMVRLGDAQLEGMTAIPLNVFDKADLRLRIWFNEGEHGFSRLAPDQALAPTPFAIKLLEPPLIPITNMARIQPGAFAMGSPTNELDRSPNEGPLTTVTIKDPFWIGVYPVTQRDYIAVAGANPSLFAGDLNRPVEMVSWQDATNYCAKLTKQERDAQRIPLGYEYRLPTEAEREYAGRAGTITRFSYGEDNAYLELNDFAWFFSNSASTTHPVGGKRPNGWGLHDLQGNVWEWCQDWYATNHAGGTLMGATGPNAGILRVLRGGSWGSEGKDCRSAARIGRDPADRRSVFGFRVVLVKH